MARRAPYGKRRYYRKYTRIFKPRTRKTRLYIEAYGGILRKIGDDLVFVSEERTMRKTISQLSSVVVYGKIAISSDVFRRLAVEDAILKALSRIRHEAENLADILA